MNPFLEDLQGAFGGLVFRRRRGKLIVAHAPIRRKAELTPAQAQVRERFMAAVRYGRAAQTNPSAQALYRPIADAQDLTVYMVALSDYLRAPRIQGIDLSAYSGRPGQGIVIRATDDVAVTRVEVMIADAAGAVVERGLAVESEPGSGCWTYTATAALPAGATPVVEAIAVDHPGNRTVECVGPSVPVRPGGLPLAV